MYYTILVQGHLNPFWQSRLGGLQLAYEADGTTRLSGSLPDQAALHGVLLQIVRLGLTLIALATSEASKEEQPVVNPRGPHWRHIEHGVPSLPLAVECSTQEESAQMATIIPKEQLPGGTFYHLFQGGAYGGIPLSFFWVQAAPGQGPRRHVHPYAEIFVVQEGHATFTLGERTCEIEAGNVVIGPVGVPHKFINSGEGILRPLDLHPSPEVMQAWREG